MPLLFTSLFSGGIGAPPPVRTFFQTYFETAENSPFESGTGLTAQVASVNRRTFLSWDVPGEHADVEVLARITTDKPSVARMGIMLRGGGSAGSEIGWFVQRARADERFEIGRYDGGAFTVGQDSGAAQFVKPDARWVWIRARIAGSTISARIWADAVQDEPADWQLAVTDSAIPGPGRIGVFGFDANTRMFLDHLAVGVGGAVAPSAGDALGSDQYRMAPETTDIAADWTSRWGTPGTALARVTTEPTQLLPHGWQGMWGSAGSATTVDLSSGQWVAFTLDGTDARAFVYAPMGRMPPDKIQRFADLILMRANACVAQAEDPEAFQTAMTQRSTMEMQDWATGFSYACEHFRSSWPAKSTAADDRAMQARVSEATASGFSSPEAKTLSLWVAARHARNVGA